MKIRAIEIDILNVPGYTAYLKAVGEGGSADDRLYDIGANGFVLRGQAMGRQIGDPFISNGLVYRINDILRELTTWLEEDGKGLGEEAIAEATCRTLEKVWGDLVYGHPAQQADKPTSADVLAVFGLITAYDEARKGKWMASFLDCLTSEKYVEAFRRVIQVRERRRYGTTRFKIHGKAYGECVVFYPEESKAEAVRLAEIATGEMRTFLVRRGNRRYEAFHIGREADMDGIIAALADEYGVDASKVSVSLLGGAYS